MLMFIQIFPCNKLKNLAYSFVKHRALHKTQNASLKFNFTNNITKYYTKDRKNGKVQLFWEDHKNLPNRPNGFDVS